VRRKRNDSKEKVMHAAVKQRKSLASPLSTRQYAELRADLEAELRRLLPGETAGEGKLHDLLPSSRARALTIVGVLRRMDSEGFGVCVGCRSPIAYERLAAIPETTVCARCSRRRELALQS
jgi:Prokaryotic dksA/traR C4-type zinc finger.